MKRKIKLRKLVKKGLHPKRKFKKKIYPKRTTWIGKKTEDDDGWVQNYSGDTGGFDEGPGGTP